MEIKEQIYEAVMGMYEDKKEYLIDGIQVKDAFARGEKCEEYYDNVHNAKMRLCAKLSDSDYEDVEVISQRLEQIAHDIAVKMFEYGVEYGKRIKE